jgi:hypothetical protein
MGENSPSNTATLTRTMQCAPSLHLSLLGHAVAHDLVHRGFGHAAADGQALTMPSAVVDQRARLRPRGSRLSKPPHATKRRLVAQCSKSTAHARRARRCNAPLTRFATAVPRPKPGCVKTLIVYSRMFRANAPGLASLRESSRCACSTNPGKDLRDSGGPASAWTSLLSFPRLAAE